MLALIHTYIHAHTHTHAHTYTHAHITHIPVWMILYLVCIAKSRYI